ncbi:hypothetical protein [Methylobacterium trifolii]|uniref:Uncharacterized protein n=1 Tax=Methylobacterium trifolii TaxID=1003092 RepID=A0ABQ4U6Q2_9HYPH|nr:hypothetical protein [Methylobacterium trifolii]GJE62547.1 hypothetical protein MPOCJGCO_4680 [Methylobacterium trifolii]
MTNVIRPTFGKGRPEPSAPTSEPIAEYVPLRVYGTVAGFLVALMRDDAGPEGSTLKVVVGPVAGNSVEAVAVYPADGNSEIDAEACGLAVLRALEVVEAGGGANGALGR